LTSDDVILDLACGNGALTKHLFSSCSGCTGVDVSEHLIAIAKANFEMLPHYSFEQHGAGAYVDAEYQPTRYTKALCYGSFQYFSEDEASAVLRTLFEKFSRTQRVFIGNLPDKARAEIFYKREPDIDELNNFHSPIGCWRTQQEFAQLARTAGWQVTFSAMPPAFYAASYRYDALLSRA
jgi:cyclopropane fatty-acyl-phospholipid synthase-like methyltransferase